MLIVMLIGLMVSKQRKIMIFKETNVFSKWNRLEELMRYIFILKQMGHLGLPRAPGPSPCLKWGTHVNPWLFHFNV